MMPAFIDPGAQHRWTSYFAEVDRVLAGAGPDAAELRNDLIAHVADSMAADPAGSSELARLDAALHRLGRPLDYLRPMLADDLIERGTRTYRPTTIARGLFHSLLAGSRRAMVAAAFGIGYLLLAIFVAMALLKPVWGEHIGLLKNADGQLTFGIVSHAAGSHELLGWWAIPLSLALAAIIYVALTKALRRMRG